LPQADQAQSPPAPEGGHRRHAYSWPIIERR
jgi:hypothetical protein